MSRLDDFITANRGEFEDKLPPVKAWQHIEAALSGKKKKQSIVAPFIKWSMAAAAVTIICISVYMMVNRNNRPPVEIAKNDIVDTLITIEAPEVNQFAQLIAMKQQELKSLAKEQPELYQQFTNDIDQLDSSYNTLKKQLGATPNREMLIEAMIQNLQLQLNVLNQQLNIINQIKQKKYSYEKIS